MAAAHVSSGTLFKHSPLTLRKHSEYILWKMPSEHHPLNMSDTQSWLPQVRNDENLTWWMALFWDFFSGQPSTYTAVQRVLISNGWTAHLTACSWVNKSRFMTGGWRVRSVTLSSSNPIHGSTLPARISINDTKEEIWKGIIPSYFPSFLCWCCPLMNHKAPGGFTLHRIHT